MSNSNKQRRTIFERVEAIFDFIETQNPVFPKSRLKEIGLNPKAAEKWLKLIDFIQKKPKIRLIKSEHNTLIEKVEGDRVTVDFQFISTQYSNTRSKENIITGASEIESKVTT